MSLGTHLHLDEVVTSYPELGPTVPDGGYSWIILFGVFLIQMTIPSVLSMYGIVLGYLAESNGSSFYTWHEKLIFTPILFIAFWSLADPWTKAIVSMASVPRLVGIIGVALLSVGVIASGYLATGGVGAYLASSSAGAVMGIGASFVILQSDHVLRKYFRKRLLLALTIRNIGASVGLIFVPGLMHVLLTQTDLKTSLLMMTIVFVPTALGTITLRSPAPQRASPYRLLLSSEEDNELPIKISPDVIKNESQNDQDNREHNTYSENDGRVNEQSLYSEGNNIYSYQEHEEDVDLFVNPVMQSNSKWKQQIRVFKSLQFWAATVGWLGMKLTTLYFWILLPALSLRRTYYTYPTNWMILPIAAGFATLLPSIASYKILKYTRQSRRIYFGMASWLSGAVLIALTYTIDYTWILIYAILGGLSIGGLHSCQDLALYDALGTENARRAHKAVSTLIGVCILIFCLIQDIDVCLQLIALLQFIGGIYWSCSPITELLRDGQHRNNHSMNDQKNQRRNLVTIVLQCGI